jgi:hypothetical protein
MAANQIFVFGSNLAGRHGAGAALHAKKHYGAQYGVGVGPTGRAYAIPTKDGRVKTLPIFKIGEFVNDFLEYAGNNPNERFFVTRVGCGLAGYKDYQIAPMFINAPPNCELPNEWAPYL